ncbi:helix-turn-helix domain-containing protein [Angustibacter luteus]|uniref:Helix-turn-helix domain-containing protein n=1 Tax=Angustibacter luteus TaxID=658456 RepID=A0ABW1JIH1_9ACTN
MTQTEELLTSTQAGLRLGKSGRTVVRMIQAGKLRAVGQLPGPNGAFLIRRSDVEALAAGRESA